jgi:hypothetical protein
MARLLRACPQQRECRIAGSGGVRDVLVASTETRNAELPPQRVFMRDITERNRATDSRTGSPPSSDPSETRL